MPLTYPPFSANAQLRAASDNSRPLRRGDTGDGVALLQGALVDLGEKLPISLLKGFPDGIYGSETFAAVSSFQSKHKPVGQDGVAGKDTVGLVDKLMLVKHPLPPPGPIPPPPPPVTDQYEVGTADPVIKPDPGAGPYGSKPTTMTMQAVRASVYAILPIANRTIGDDAVKHMRHYLDNSGRTFTIDLEGMVREVPSAQARFELEVAQAKEYAELLAPGRYQIHSRKAEGGYNRKSENANWFFAIGGYSTWGRADVSVVSKGGTARDIKMDFEYRFFDRYNWDAGKSVTIAGIKVTDVFMGEFHRQGIAREFDCVGSFKRTFMWTAP